MEEIITAISTVGFPIVCVIFMWQYISKSLDKTNDIITSFKETIAEFRVTMTENNRLMTKICDKLDVFTDD